MTRFLFLPLATFVVLAACVGNGDPHHDHTLVRVDQEPQGSNCKYGGTVIHSGIDGDANNALDDSEISSSEYICDLATAVKCVEGSTKVDGPISLRLAADFAQLSGVNCIDGDLMIVGSQLAALPEVASLDIVTGNVIVAGNGSLQSLAGFPNLREVGRRYVVQGNDALTDIAALGVLRRFGGGIAIVGNDALVDVAGLSPFVEIDGGLQISNNSSLTSLHGLENLTRGTRDGILIRSNKNLTSVSALSQLRSAVLLEFSGNVALPSLPLQSLEKVDVYILIKDNAGLITLELPTLFTTGGLIVQTNPALTSINSPELVLSASIAVEGNTSLTAMSAPKLSYTTVNFDLVNLPQLTLANFPSLVAIGGPLYMYRLPQLTSLAGFSSLSSIGGNFTLRACNGLPNFAGFTNLIDVANMTVTENTQLTSFMGLDSFTKVGGDLMIVSNPNVSYSTAQAFANAILVVGTTTIN